jgi:gluconolactonase
MPLPNGPVTSLCLGGANGDVLFAICGGKLHQRKLPVPGAQAWAAPTKPALPRL